MSKEQQGKKFSSYFKQNVIGLYLGCLNYNKVARLLKISPNSVKNIVNEEKKKNPKNFAKLCTKLYKKNNKIIEQRLEEVQNEQFLSASFHYLDNPYKLNQYMNLQDRQLISRNKLLYDAKASALTYEALRIERALKLRDYKKLTEYLKEAEKDTSLYEPIDFNFLGTEAYFGVNNHNNKLSYELKTTYIKRIEDYLKAKGYDLTNIDLEEFIASKEAVENYYYN